MIFQDISSRFMENALSVNEDGTLKGIMSLRARVGPLYAHD